jgi:hypothetical protein
MSARPRGPLSKTTTAIDVQGLGRFAAMAGSSIAGRSSVDWVTHLLNASYYGVPRESRDLAHLPLAWAVLTTYWHQLGGGPLGARHVRRFHQSFRAARSPDGSSYPRRLLDAARRQRARGETPVMPPELAPFQGDTPHDRGRQ